MFGSVIQMYTTVHVFSFISPLIPHSWRPGHIPSHRLCQIHSSLLCEVPCHGGCRVKRACNLYQLHHPWIIKLYTLFRYFIDVANITGQMHIRMLGQYGEFELVGLRWIYPSFERTVTHTPWHTHTHTHSIQNAKLHYGCKPGLHCILYQQRGNLEVPLTPGVCITADKSCMPHLTARNFLPISLTHMHTTYTRHAHMLMQYSYPFIKSPIFVLNSQYDTWQLANILQLGCLPPRCSESQMKFFENFRNVRLVNYSKL